MASTETSDASSPKMLSETSHGSSVSSDLQREYEDFLKYALVTPRFEAVPSAYEKPAAFRADKRDDQCIISSPESAPSSSQSTQSQDTEEMKQNSVMLSFEKLANPVSCNQLHFAKGAAPNVCDTVQLMSNAREEENQTDQHHGSSSARSSISNTSLMNGVLDGALDEEQGRMENLLDIWCLELKRNILDELSNNKLKLLDNMKQKMEVQMKRHAREEAALQDQIEKHKELLHTFEKSINQKDLVITNLTDALEKQKEKQEKLKMLLTWKLKHNDERRETFASKMAEKHYKRSILSKIWLGWRSVIELRWKQRVERACQSRSQEICVKLTEDYEERLKGLQKSLEMSRLEVARLHNERDAYEETMKKAFMRGVCALNLEAMQMFREQAYEEDGTGNRGENGHENRSECANRQPKFGSKGSTSKKIGEDNPNGGQRKMPVSVVGKGGFQNKATKQFKTGKHNTQPSITSVYVEKHKPDRDAGPAKISAHNGPSTVAIGSAKPKGRNVAKETKIVM